ncbi:hypothetical protein LZ30DRAFT_238464 [Colletotrichum cereale]|nr:hypothetical protein LZ30DRAFT_238464 [Colletotrichum cereale]
MPLSPGEVRIGQNSPRRGVGWPHQPPRSATCMLRREARRLRALQSPLADPPTSSLPKHSLRGFTLRPLRPLSSSFLSPLTRDAIHVHVLQRINREPPTHRFFFVAFPFHHECTCTYTNGRLDPGTRIRDMSGPGEVRDVRPLLRPAVGHSPHPVVVWE